VNSIGETKGCGYPVDNRPRVIVSV
jgi:hypothetical protein